MRVREKRVIAVASAVTIIALIVVAAMVITPSGVLTFHGRTSGRAGNNVEGFTVEVEVSSWRPFGPLFSIIGDAFWIIDGTKYDTVSATLKVKITYYGMAPNSLNITINAVWLEYSGRKSYIINAPQTGINGNNEEGTYDRYNSNPFTGSKSVSTVGSELSLPTDGSTVTVYNKYQVKVVGRGAKTGQIYSWDSGAESCTPSSNSWQWYTESTGSPSTSASVSFSSWIDMSAFAGAFIGIFIAFYALYAFRRRRVRG